MNPLHEVAFRGRVTRSRHWPAMALVLCAGTPAFAAEPATPHSLTCNIHGTTTTGASGDIRGDGVTVHPTRVTTYEMVAKYQVSDQPKAVVLQSRTGTKTGENGTTPLDPEGPSYIGDVRVLTPTLLVFCDDTNNGCRPQDKGNSTGGRNRGEVTPVTIDLASGTIGYASGISASGGNGSRLYSQSHYNGTCTKTP